MPLGSRLLVLLLGAVLALTLGSPAQAQEPTPTSLGLSAGEARADAETVLRLALENQDGSPVVGAPLEVERRVDGEWRELVVLVTDDAGRAEHAAVVRRDPADNRFRASYAGDATHEPSQSGVVEVDLLRRESVVTIAGPDSVVDEQAATLTLGWRTRSGTPVPYRVELFRRDPGRDWRLVSRPALGKDGQARVAVRPRVDTRWKAVGRGRPWVRGDVSPVHSIDNLPPGVPVTLPDAAPRPRVDVPDQPRAVGEGPNAVITRIPHGVWDHMTGRSWHSGCPVGRAGLRLLRINYWDYAGYRRRGELVAHADAVGQMAAALRDMYAANLPIRSLYRVDRFGWSSRVRGADDYRSMAAGNTSAFNCRDVVGNPGVRSPHSWGRSLDVNTWENPYRSRQGTVPNTWWMGHSHPRVAWRSRDHRVVRIMASHGLRWTYGNGDTQHFDAAAGNGRIRTALRYCDGCVSHADDR